MPITIALALTHLSDQELVAKVAHLAGRERDATADLIAALAELDARRLYLGDGCAALFTYCTERLHLSESAAYHRITAARAARRFPLILDRLREGALTLTAVGLLAPHLTDANHRRVLDAAWHQGKRAIEDLAAHLHPRPDVAASVRKLPAPRAADAERSAPAGDRPAQPDGSAVANDEPCASPSLLAGAGAGTCEERPVPSLRRPSVIHAVAPARYPIQVTVSVETHAKLRRAQDLLRHAIPDGDPAAVLDRALTMLLDHLERTKWAAVIPRPCGPATRPRPRRASSSDALPASAPRSSLDQAQELERMAGQQSRLRSRTIPAGVRRTVWVRDGGQCTYVGTSGRCTERGFLEFHHLVPFAAGGETSVENMTLLCRAHNQHEAVQDRSTSSGASSWSVSAKPAERPQEAGA